MWFFLFFTGQVGRSKSTLFKHIAICGLWYDMYHNTCGCPDWPPVWCVIISTGNLMIDHLVKRYKLNETGRVCIHTNYKTHVFFIQEPCGDLKWAVLGFQSCITIQMIPTSITIRYIMWREYHDALIHNEWLHPYTRLYQNHDFSAIISRSILIICVFISCFFRGGVNW